MDYAIIFKGSITLELEEGERVTLNEGDTVVQRGTMHTWRNESTEWAKVYFVMLGIYVPFLFLRDSVELHFRGEANRDQRQKSRRRVSPSKISTQLFRSEESYMSRVCILELN